MARSQPQPTPEVAERITDESTTEPTPASLIPALPADFAFTVSENVLIPEAAPRYRPPSHPWVELYDKMGHNSSFFVPVSYWITKRERTAENTPFSWQAQTIRTTFNDWKKKGSAGLKAGETNPREKWSLTTIHRELGADPEFPTMAGIRAWKVDSTR